MKKRAIRFFSVLMCFVVLLTSFIHPMPVRAATGWFGIDSQEDIDAFREKWGAVLTDGRGEIYGALASEMNGGEWWHGYLVGGILQSNIEYYNNPSKVFDYVNSVYHDSPYNADTSQPGYSYTFSGYSGDDTYDFSTTNRYQVFNDNSNYLTNYYDYSWYNPITNNYNNCDTFYYDNSTNSYYYQTTESNYSYDNYVIDNSTHVTYYIVQTDTTTNIEYEFVYDIYYKLPNGRSSYDLLADDVWGEYFVYDIANYDSVSEDDGKTLGLWHLDGNGNDSSYWNNSAASFKDVSYVDGIFSYGKYMPSTSNSPEVNATLYLDKCDFNRNAAFTLEWIEYMPVRSPYISEYITIYRINAYVVPHYCYYPLTSFDDTFVYFALVFDGSSYSLFVNGNKVVFEPYNDSVWDSFGSSDYYCGFDISNDSIKIMCSYISLLDSNSQSLSYDVPEHYESIIDEVRLSKGVLYTSNYVPTSEPFTTNSVLVIPDDVEKGDILIHSNYEVSSFRIGGAKPTFPSENYVYVALDDDDIVTSVQQYQVNKWVEVSGRVYLGNDSTEDLVGYDMAEFKLTNPDDDLDDGNDDGSDGESDDDSDGSGLEALLDGIRDLFNTFGSIIGTVLSSLSDFLTSALDALSLFTDFAKGFAEFLSQAFIFIPDEIWSIIGAGLSLVIIAAIVLMFKG